MESKWRGKKFIVSVDGVHFWTREDSHDELPFDSKNFSFKWNHPGVAYEIGVSLDESRIVWFSGPWPAGTNDHSIFKKPGGLGSKIPEGCFAIADSGYHAKNVAKANSKDTPEVSDFKARAKARQETLNKRLKVFKILNDRFRHSPMEQHGIIFTAVCVLLYSIKWNLGNHFFLFSS